ncbi:hypothetical protein H640_04363 [Cutibacterium granulosum TM11]|uniref:Uncharacterized protein n=1 Tax=Cutibacterium granulosum TM11 TaxID=1292373 RepID=A0ACB4UP27_9ACTN|nr:hypothetical protein H640_04363 [Cutibacterium granulosum TM11]
MFVKALTVLPYAENRIRQATRGVMVPMRGTTDIATQLDERGRSFLHTRQMDRPRGVIESSRN